MTVTGITFRLVMLSFPGGQVEASSSPRGVSIVKLMGKKSGYIAMQVRQAVARWGERVAGSGDVPSCYSQLSSGL